MTRLGIVGALLMVVAASAGCSVCCTPFDYAYPAYGGKWERTDRFNGRVGSAFAPAGPIPETAVNDIEQPTPVNPMDGMMPEGEAMPMEQPEPAAE